LFGLKWQDIDFTKGMLHIRRALVRMPTGQGYKETEPKTEKSRRSIVLTSKAIRSLKEHRRQQDEVRAKVGAAWQEHDYVFCTPVGTHLTPGHNGLVQLKGLLEKAGLPDIRFHDLRHSTATLLLSEGVHPKVVQEILGHSEISMTMDTYSHVLPTMQKDAMSKLDNLF
jgi:integrase